MNSFFSDRIHARWVPLAMLVGLALLGFLPGRLVAQEGPGEAAKATTVSLTLDFGDNSQKSFVKIPWVEGMTAFDLLEKASKHRRGFSLISVGKGETLLVTSIDGSKNEGSGDNWIFEVNGKLGAKSCAITKLKGGDSVLWRFGRYE